MIKVTANNFNNAMFTGDSFLIDGEIFYVDIERSRGHRDMIFTKSKRGDYKLVITPFFTTKVEMYMISESVDPEYFI